ncbi:hypothetical protein [Mycolicibacter heraklionensis]|uniref:hypothetical protein n=1 Tax=Mycolicibacter heraklionensis TaxID=512402 RepID=UPI0007EAC80C|nr:hypothetical protein [Mycolicibacter heraklionensis]OBG31998.1 hypothetical protein A5671_08600 [Mycolicibacter heraklionensis]
MSLKGVVVAAALVGTAVEVFDPSGPGPLSGSYTMTITDGAGIVRAGSAYPWSLSPCGPGCLNVRDTAIGWDKDAHLEGNRWVWTIDDGKLTHSFDQRTLAGKLAGSSTTIWWVLTKNA